MFRVLDRDDLALVGKNHVAATLQEGPDSRVRGQSEILFRAESHGAVYANVAGNPLFGDWAVEVFLPLL